jgi:serine protease Do
MIATTALPTLSTDLADLAERLRASVVQVHAGDRGIGSGVIWRVEQPDASGVAEATIITNAHVAMAARGSALAVKLIDPASESRATLPAILVAVDPSHDLASLRVRATGLRPADIGDSASLRVGELVVALGNPFGREGALTAGVVAARAPVDLEESAEHAEPIAPSDEWQWSLGRGRRFETEVIQADIRLYPGNSGGPLADAHGRVVGINAMVVGGLGFAIPSRTVQAFLAQAGQSAERPYLGVELLTVPVPPAQQARFGLAQPAATLITGVAPGSPAETAGVLVGDVLLAVNGQPITEAGRLLRILARNAQPEGPLTLQLLRGGARIELALTPELRAAA